MPREEQDEKEFEEEWNQYVEKWPGFQTLHDYTLSWWLASRRLMREKEEENGRERIRGEKAVSDRQVESSSSQHSPKSNR